MKIVHQKVSAVSDTADATLVQPSDWNEPHYLGHRSFVILGVVRFAVEGTTLTEMAAGNAVGMYVTGVVRLGTGQYKIFVNFAQAVTDLAGPGKRIDIAPHISMIKDGTIAVRHYWSVDTDHVLFELADAMDNPINPASRIEIYITMIGVVNNA